MKVEVIYVLCSLLVVHVAGTMAKCTPPDSSISSSQYAYINGHSQGDNSKSYLYLGGLFGIHYTGETVNSCGAIRTRGIHNLEAFLWAVRTFKNRYPSSLGGVNIGALAFDSCSDNFHLVQQYANFHQCLIGYGEPAVDPATLLAYVGPDRSGEAAELATYVGTHGPPMVSHAATSSLLSDKDEYPRLLRTVPSDTDQVQALVDMLMKSDWKYVQFIHSDNAYGYAGKNTFMKLAEKAGICIVNQERIPQNFDEDRMEEIVDSLNANLLTRAVVIFANEDAVREFMEAATGRNTRGRFTWFGTTAWATDPTVTEGVQSTAEGAVTLALEEIVPTQFVDHFRNLQPNTNNANPWFMEYWSEKFNCYFADIPNPNGYSQLCDDLAASLEETKLDGYVGYTIQATDAILLAIDEIRKAECTLASDGLCENFLDGDQWNTIFENILQLKRDSVSVFNTTTGDPITSTYDIYNYRTCSRDEHCYEKIGDYNTRTDVLNLEVTEVHTYDLLGERRYETTSECSQSPCTVCGEVAPVTTTLTTNDNSPNLEPGASGSDTGRSVTLRSDAWVIPLLILAGVGVLLVIIFDAFLLCKIFRTPYMKHWRTMWLGQLLLVGILLCYLTLFAFVPTPTKATCGIIRFGVGVSYAMCFSVLLVKLLIVLSSETIGELKGVFQILMFLFAWGVQIAVDAELLILKRPGTVPASADDPALMQCQHGDFISHVQSLVYVMFLIFLCTVLAIRTHKIVTNHREGVFIGICAGFTIPIWIVWIVLGIYHGDPSFHEPCLAYGLFVTATLLLFVMFLPKVRQLNSMGVEGIYAEYDSPDFTPSIVQPTSIQKGPPSVMGYPPSIPQAPPSVVGYAPSKASDGSLVLIPNGTMNKHPLEVKQAQSSGNYSLHLRHVGPQRIPRDSMDTASVQSAPLGPTYMVRRARPQPSQDRENIHATTRVLRMTNDLTGRREPVIERRANSEHDYTPLEQNHNSVAYKPPVHTVADLGSL